MKKCLIALVALAVAAVAVEAGARAKRVPRAKKREAVQRDRIRDGVQDGSLTQREAARLAREQKRIQNAAKKMASDGQVTPREKAKLEHAQDQANRHIAGERHDAQGDMGPTPPRNWKTWDPGVNTRQRIQHHRIAQGIRSGSLTPVETRQLIQAESDIRKLERALKSDGVLTRGERAQLHAALNEASREIFALKHNDVERPGVSPALRRLVDGGRFSRADAQELLAQLRRLLQIRRMLGGPAMPAEQRAALEDEFAALAAQIFA
jgi:hypothetical protein